MGRTYRIHQSLTIHLFIATVIKYHLILLRYFKYNLFFVIITVFSNNLWY